jgi:hypothetical protein
MTSHEASIAKKPSNTYRVTFYNGMNTEGYIVNAGSPTYARAKVKAHVSLTFGIGHYAGWPCKVSKFRGAKIESTETDLRS